MNNDSIIHSSAAELAAAEAAQTTFSFFKIDVDYIDD